MYNTTDSAEYTSLSLFFITPVQANSLKSSPLLCHVLHTKNTPQQMNDLLKYIIKSGQYSLQYPGCPPYRDNADEHIMWKDDVS